jgi:lipopolysaccharide export system protein LptA
MRTLLLVVGIFGFVVLADGQTTPRPVQISADSMTRTSTSIQLRGNVRISDGSSVIVADTAEVPNLPWQSPAIDVSGNVHITFDGSRPALVNQR